MAKIDHKRFMELYNQRLPDWEIGKALGYSKSVICRYRQSNGLPAISRRQGVRSRPTMADEEKATMRRQILRGGITEGAKVIIKERSRLEGVKLYRGIVRYINKHYFMVEVNTGYRVCWLWHDVDIGLVRVS